MNSSIVFWLNFQEHFICSGLLDVGSGFCVCIYIRTKTLLFKSLISMKKTHLLVLIRFFLIGISFKMRKSFLHHLIGICLWMMFQLFSLLSLDSYWSMKTQIKFTKITFPIKETFFANNIQQQQQIDSFHKYYFAVLFMVHEIELIILNFHYNFHQSFFFTARLLLKAEAKIAFECYLHKSENL